MIVDALLKADPYLKIAERINDPRRFMHLDDSILLEVERSECPVSGCSYCKPQTPNLGTGAGRVTSNHAKGSQEGLV
jgi:hypothetical protein